MDPQAPGLELTALLGRGTHFEGKLFFTGRVRIDGAFRGHIRSDETLVIGEGAEVEADIEVDTLIVKGGSVRGSIRARSAIELYVPATIVGNLRAPSVFIDKGVKVEGSCTMAPLDPAPVPTPPGPAPTTGDASIPPPTERVPSANADAFRMGS